VTTEQNSFRKEHAETVAPTFWQLYKGSLWECGKAFLVFQASRLTLIGVAACTGEGRISPETHNVIVIGAALVAMLYYGNLKMKPEAKQRAEAFRTRMISGAAGAFARINWAGLGSITGKVATAGAIAVGVIACAAVWPTATALTLLALGLFFWIHHEIERGRL
jgi:hypothetical protein